MNKQISNNKTLYTSIFSFRCFGEYSLRNTYPHLHRNKYNLNYVCLAITLFSLLFFSFPGTLLSQDRLAVISNYEGEVKVQHENVWKEVKKVGNRIRNSSVYVGDTVQTMPASKADLVFDDNTRVEISEDTTLSINTRKMTDAELAKRGFVKTVAGVPSGLVRNINLKAGKLWANITPSKSVLTEFESPTGVASVRGTIIREFSYIILGSQTIGTQIIDLLEGLVGFDIKDNKMSLEFDSGDKAHIELLAPGHVKIGVDAGEIGFNTSEGLIAMRQDSYIEAKIELGNIRAISASGVTITKPDGTKIEVGEGVDLGKIDGDTEDDDKEDDGTGDDFTGDENKEVGIDPFFENSPAFQNKPENQPGQEPKPEPKPEPQVFPSVFEDDFRSGGFTSPQKAGSDAIIDGSDDWNDTTNASVATKFGSILASNEDTSNNFARIATSGSGGTTGDTVNVFGERFNLNTINNFYNGLSGVTSTILSGTLDQNNLTGVDLLWAVQPADSYTTAEIDKMKEFLDSGGRIAFMGEHSGFAPNENARITDAISQLGGNISITNTTVDGGFHDATRENGQILSNTLTEGVNTFNYAAFAPMNISGSAEKLMYGTNLSSIMLANQSVRSGNVFVMTDQNTWDNVNSASNDNNVLFQNLLGTSGAGVLQKKFNFTDAGTRNIKFNYNYVTVNGDGSTSSNIKAHLHQSDGTTVNLSLSLTNLSAVSGLDTSLISSSDGYQTGWLSFNENIENVPSGETTLEFHVENNGSTKKDVLLIDNVVDPLVAGYAVATETTTPSPGTDYLLTFARMMRDTIDNEVKHQDDAAALSGRDAFIAGVDTVISKAENDPNAWSVMDLLTDLNAARNSLIDYAGVKESKQHYSIAQALLAAKIYGDDSVADHYASIKDEIQVAKAFMAEHINDFGESEEHTSIDSKINSIIAKLDTVGNNTQDIDALNAIKNSTRYAFCNVIDHENHSNENANPFQFCHGNMDDGEKKQE